jgi:hypothetical protein
LEVEAAEPQVKRKEVMEVIVCFPPLQQQAVAVADLARTMLQPLGKMG